MLSIFNKIVKRGYQKSILYVPQNQTIMNLILKDIIYLLTGHSGLKVAATIPLDSILFVAFSIRVSSKPRSFISRFILPAHRPLGVPTGKEYYLFTQLPHRTGKAVTEENKPLHLNLNIFSLLAATLKPTQTPWPPHWSVSPKNDQDHQTNSLFNSLEFLIFIKNN